MGPGDGQQFKRKKVESQNLEVHMYRRRHFWHSMAISGGLPSYLPNSKLSKRISVLEISGRIS